MTVSGALTAITDFAHADAATTRRRAVASSDLSERREIYLRDNALLRRPLEPDDIKPRPLGHLGTVPGLALLYAHLNRIIAERGTEMPFLAGPG